VLPPGELDQQILDGIRFPALRNTHRCHPPDFEPVPFVRDQDPICPRGVFGDSIKQGRWSHFVTTSSSIIVPNWRACGGRVDEY